MVLTLGLVWLFVLSMIIVYQGRECELRWATVKRGSRLNTLRDPTSQPRKALVVGGAVHRRGRDDRTPTEHSIENAWVSVFPFLAEPEGYSFDAILGSQRS